MLMYFRLKKMLLLKIFLVNAYVRSNFGYINIRAIHAVKSVCTLVVIYADCMVRAYKYDNRCLVVPI